MTITWVDGVPYNEFAEQLFPWPDCDTGAMIVEDGVPLLCPTHPCEAEPVTACCLVAIPLTLNLTWDDSTVNGVPHQGGGSATLTWNAGADAWETTVGGVTVYFACRNNGGVDSFYLLNSDPTLVGSPFVELLSHSCDPLNAFGSTLIIVDTEYVIEGLNVTEP